MPDRTSEGRHFGVMGPLRDGALPMVHVLE